MSTATRLCPPGCPGCSGEVRATGTVTEVQEELPIPRVIVHRFPSGGRRLPGLRAPGCGAGSGCMGGRQGEIDVLGFWGKARPRQRDGFRWHPLAFHCLDVAAVGETLLTRNHGLRRSLGHLLRLRRAETVRLLCFLLCLHDVGKFAKCFQAKEPQRFPDCFDDDPADLPSRYDHGAGGLRLFDAAPDVFHLPGGPEGRHLRAWRPLVSAVMGHHGSPPTSDGGVAGLTREFGTVGIRAARAFIREAHARFALPELPVPDRRQAGPASHAVAGLAVLADWIGSNQDWFPYHDPAIGLDAYWSHARERAARAVDESGVVPAPAKRGFDYQDLLGAGAEPSPMQRWAREVDLPAGPALFLVEDETGSGKTEAALMLAHRLLESGRADGLYVALPTMATANAMFDRLADACARFFAEDAVPSIALAHGARDLHAGFRAAMTRGDRSEAHYSQAEQETDESDATASTACAAWIADDRRRAFLADAGAGTVDQALLSVLPSRHQSLRLLGLMRRVLVLDEVHAYDAYMQSELETLVEFQAGLGGSAILLSATLPGVIRRRLVKAFRRGLAGRNDDRAGTRSVDARSGEDLATCYPLATLCAADVRTSTPVAGRTGRARVLPIRFIRSADTAVREVLRAARAGKAVLYIRNTVDDALDAHAELRRRGLAPALFHARFALSDRLAIETEVVRRFGKHGGAAARAGQVLVATQVVEQSLDLDFDAVVTDLAPIDLLIQRAGRLWRHHRPERGGRPELLVVGPEPVADAPENWFARSFPRAEHVYRDHARIWLSAKKLHDAGVIDSPGGLRDLVEGVYGDDAAARLPPALRDRLRQAQDRAGTERGVAGANTLNLAKGFVRDGGAWDSDVRTPTRLADEPHRTLRLARVRDGDVEPWARESASDDASAWRLSELNVSARRIGGEWTAPQHVSAVHKAKGSWTRFDKEKILVLFDEAGDGAAAGRGRSGSDAPARIPLRYDPRVGLTWSRPLPS